MTNLKFLLMLLALNLNQCFGQKTESPSLNNYIEKADQFFHAFKYDSASVYYGLAAKEEEQKENWLASIKDYRLASNSLICKY